MRVDLTASRAKQTATLGRSLRGEESHVNRLDFIVLMSAQTVIDKLTHRCPQRC